MGIVTRLRAASLAILVSACGGGGGGGGGSPPAPPPPPPVQQAPTFTSATTVSVPENWSDVVYRPTATDAQGDTITYDAITGEDAHHFEMNPVTREVRFDFHPNFESPSDESHDNVYSITFSASDGTNTTTHKLAITLTDVRPGFRVRQVSQQGLQVEGYPDGSGRIVLWNHEGHLQLIDPATTNDGIRMLDIRRLQPTGPAPYNFFFADFAFSPNFLVDRTLYATVVKPVEKVFQVWKYRMSATNIDQIDEASQDVIFSTPLELGRFGGFLLAREDGTLLVGVGTGTLTEIGEEVAQDPTSVRGKILRIDPRTDSYPDDPLKDYAIPAQNPYASGGGAPEVWARGVASPRDAYYDRFDQGSNGLYFTDGGEFINHAYTSVDAYEINRPGSTDMNGPNFGWPWQVGLSWRDATPPAGLFYRPVTYFSGLPISNIMMAGVYRGPIEDFRGLVFFGNGGDKIWSVPNTLIGAGTTSTTPSLYTDRTAAFATGIPMFPTGPGTVGSIYGLDFDTRGNLYIIAAGGVFIVEPLP